MVRRSPLAGPARQISHVIAHRATVPAANLPAGLNLAAHQKAADYTVARTRFGRAGLAVEVAILLAFTLGGGSAGAARLLEWRDSTACLRRRADLQRHGDFRCSLICRSRSIGSFVIEEKFGFNRMTCTSSLSSTS
jgi:STE24 endopeptidase